MKSVRNISVMMVLAAAVQTVPVFAGTTPGETTISTAGSTALKNWFGAKKRGHSNPVRLAVYSEMFLSQIGLDMRRRR